MALRLGEVQTPRNDLSVLRRVKADRVGVAAVEAVSVAGAVRVSESSTGSSAKELTKHWL